MRVRSAVLAVAMAACAGSRAAPYDDAVVARVATQHKKQSRKCYSEALNRNPRARGELDLGAAVTAGGRVKTVWVRRSTLNDEGLRRCVIADVYDWRFPEPEGGRGEFTWRLRLDTGTIGIGTSRLSRDPDRERELRRRRERLAAYEKHPAAEKWQVAMQIGGVAAVLAELGRHGEALAEHRRALALIEEAQGPEGTHVVGVLTSIGEDVVALRRYDEALAVLDRAAAIERKQTGGGVSSSTPPLLLARGRAACALGRCEEAMKTFRAEVARVEGRKGVFETRLAQAFAVPMLHAWARLLLEQGRAAEAVPLLERARDTLRHAFPNLDTRDIDEDLRRARDAGP